MKPRSLANGSRYGILRWATFIVTAWVALAGISPSSALWAQGNSGVQGSQVGTENPPKRRPRVGLVLEGGELSVSPMSA